jgi:DNA modification methylase
MKATTVKISEVKANPNNPRIIKDDKFQKLVKSIKEFPEMLNIRPIVVNADMVVLGGNMRLKACKEAGLKELPIIKADDLTEEQQKQFIIKDNVGFGEWDWEDLANNWDSEQLTEWGLDIPDFEPKVLEAEEDDYEMPDEIHTDIVLGDLFEIGPHRLLCGNSTDSDQVAKLMNGQKADMAHNDPPYGMKKEKDGVLNDNLNYNDLLDFNREWIALQFMHLKEKGSWYCWGIDEPLMDIYSEILKPYIADQKATFRNLITWDKGHGQGQNSENTRSYAIADEKCLFAMMGVQSFEFERNEQKYNIVFEKLRLYFEDERKKSKLSVEELSKIDSTRVSHYWAKSQWEFPTKEAYKKIQNYCIENNINAFKKEYEELKKEYEELKKEYYSTRAYFNNTHDNFNNVWKFERHLRQGDEGGHATPKPIPLCERAIKSSCPDNGLVLDMFLGSGSTMVASHQLKRKCYGMELDSKYCQVIVDRMMKLDPSLEIKRNGIKYIKTTE